MKRLCFSGLLLILAFFPVQTLLHAEVSHPAPFTAEDISKQIEKRRGTWIALKADVELEFKRGENQAASCRGTLLYQRLDEAFRLDCFNQNEQLLFTFKTQDRDFELYLPAQKSLYQGNIFSLQDSPAIESRLQPLDLYRALNPKIIPTGFAEAGQAADGMASVEITQKDGTPARSMLVSNQGDIVQEVYYGMDGNPGCEIKRKAFEKIIPAPAAETDAVFPKEISITSKKELGPDSSVTEFFFTKTNFYAELTESDFTLQLPEDIRTLVLEDHPENF